MVSCLFLHHHLPFILLSSNLLPFSILILLFSILILLLLHHLMIVFQLLIIFDNRIISLYIFQQILQNQVLYLFHPNHHLFLHLGYLFIVFVYLTFILLHVLSIELSIDLLQLKNLLQCLLLHLLESKVIEEQNIMDINDYYFRIIGLHLPLKYISILFLLLMTLFDFK